MADFYACSEPEESQWIRSDFMIILRLLRVVDSYNVEWILHE